MDPLTAQEPKLQTDPALIADEGAPRPTPPTSHARFVVGAVAAIAALGIIAWFISKSSLPPPSPAKEEVSATRPPPEAMVPRAEIRHPIAEEPGAQQLPDLADSDQAFGDAFAAVLPGGKLGRWLIPQNLIRNIVATVDNLPRHTLPRRVMPLLPIPGTFVVSEQGGGYVIAAANAQRYVPLIRLLEAIDPEKLVAVYVHWYPRFQDAYRELGYSHAYFNDRLVDAIDSMLASPQVPAAVGVVQPKVLWQFEDPEFEMLPIGQRVMLRMGPDNATRVKARLLALRRLVARVAPDDGSGPGQSIAR
jgi:hypothetical protein